jgi:hypothetical protein
VTRPKSEFKEFDRFARRVTGRVIDWGKSVMPFWRSNYSVVFTRVPLICMARLELTKLQTDQIARVMMNTFWTNPSLSLRSREVPLSRVPIEVLLQRSDIVTPASSIECALGKKSKRLLKHQTRHFIFRSKMKKQMKYGDVHKVRTNENGIPLYKCVRLDRLPLSARSLCFGLAKTPNGICHCLPVGYCRIIN